MLNPRDLSYSEGAPITAHELPEPSTPSGSQIEHPDISGHPAGHTSMNHPGVKAQLDFFQLTAATFSLNLGDMLTSDQFDVDPDPQARIS